MQSYHVIGLMSGSSLDGLDICYARFDWADEKWAYQILATACCEYSPELKDNLQKLPQASAMDLAAMHVHLAHVFADFLTDFRAKNKIDKIDLIASHGHTVFHQPARSFSCQIGCGATLAARSKALVVADFRSMDIALGGQGAPLVPMGEKLLLPQYQQFLNIGGICNISIHEQSKFIAYDVCPANTLLNYLALKKGAAFDHSGLWARAGKVDEVLLKKLNALPYYQQEGPKSLGTETIHQDWMPLIEAAEISVEDKLSTVCEHIALQLGKAIQSGEIVVTGGGGLNDYLCERIARHAKAKVLLPDADTIAYKEALIFGFLGLLRVLGQNNTLHTVTGADANTCSGAVHDGRSIRRD